MNTMRSNVAGVDVHKEKLTITALFNQGGESIKETWECGTFTEDLIDAAKKLKSLGIFEVAMESTGVYWRPVVNVWKEYNLIITLGNAYNLKNVPGRKTDVKDSEWIAQLHRAGLIRSSYIPDEQFSELRALTRHRTTLVEESTRIKNRVQKILEDANIKLGSVLSDVFGVAGTKIIKAIIENEKDPEKLAELATTNIRSSKEVIKKSLEHRIRNYQIEILKQLYRQFLNLSNDIDEFDQMIDNKFSEFKKILSALDAVPGINKRSAEIILAEATNKMDTFKDCKSFAAWAGVAPGNYQSAGKKKRVRCIKGNPSLKKALIQAANAAVKKKNSFYQAKYRKLIQQTGSANKAKVAIANKIAKMVFMIIKDHTILYKDPGPEKVYRNTQRQIKNSIKRLEALGVDVQFIQKDIIIATKTDEIRVSPKV